MVLIKVHIQISITYIIIMSNISYTNRILAHLLSYNKNQNSRNILFVTFN